MVATWKVAQLLVPEPLCWLCLEQEAVIGGRLGRSSRVQVYQTWNLTVLNMSARSGNVILF